MLTKRQKVLTAALGSALIHAALLLAAGIIIARQPPTPPAPEAQPLRLEIVKSEPLTPATPTPEPRLGVLDNSKMKEADRAPSKAKFEGERNTVAASEKPAQGDKPLPSQDGRTAPNYVFDPAPPAEAMPPDAEPPPQKQPDTAPPLPAASRLAVRPAAEVPAPTLVRNDLTMLDTAPTPPPEEVNPYDPSFRSTAPPPPTPMRARPRSSAYHPMEQRTASSGDITNLGEGGVDAVATPYGRYRRQVLDAIRVVWNQALHTRSDLASLGTVKVHFAIDRTGHIHAPHLLSNSANEALASITLDAIGEAAIPPIPPDVVETMNGAMLQLDVTFECL